MKNKTIENISLKKIENRLRDYAGSLDETLYTKGQYTRVATYVANQNIIYNTSAEMWEANPKLSEMKHLGHKLGPKGQEILEHVISELIGV